MEGILDDLIRSPIFKGGNYRTGPFLRLVLAEAASYGMPPQVVATLDDVAAMIGLYDPVAHSQAMHMSGPLSVWRTSPDQPHESHVNDVAALALKQRFLIGFGHEQNGHMVGTAEIVYALGNTHRDMMPLEYYEIFQWAATDVQVKLSNLTAEQIRKEKGWKLIADDEILLPNGRLNPTYLQIANYIRRAAIAASSNSPNSPRNMLRPFADNMIKTNLEMVKELKAEGGKEHLVKAIEQSNQSIAGMYPDMAVNRLPIAEKADGSN